MDGDYARSATNRRSRGRSGVRNRLDLPDAIEGVADQKARADLRVEERPDAEMISCSENTTLLCIPDDEGEVTKQVFGAGLAPTIVSQETNSALLAFLRSFT